MDRTRLSSKTPVLHSTQSSIDNRPQQQLGRCSVHAALKTYKLGGARSYKVQYTYGIFSVNSGEVSWASWWIRCASRSCTRKTSRCIDAVVIDVPNFSICLVEGLIALLRTTVDVAKVATLLESLVSLHRYHSVRVVIVDVSHTIPVVIDVWVTYLQITNYSWNQISYNSCSLHLEDEFQPHVMHACRWSAQQGDSPHHVTLQVDLQGCSFVVVDDHFG